MNSIILFDGVCNFCNSSVNFIMDKDKKNRFVFAALQSAPGVELMKRFRLNPDELASLILIENERYFSRSTAALRISKGLGFPWSSFYIFIIIPSFLRNIAYRIIAMYRYKWFGRRDSCRIPSPKEESRFLI